MEKLTPEIKAKIAQCLAYSMEIKGAVFTHSSNNGLVNVYTVKEGEIDVDFHGFYNEDSFGKTIDDLITDLINHISKSNLETALTEENEN